MIQQINLYQDAIREKFQGSAVNRHLAVLLGLISILSIFSLYGLWNLSQLQSRVEASKQQLTAEQTRVSALLAKFPKQQQDQALTQQISQTQAKIIELNQALQFLAQENALVAGGFSSYLRALANQSAPELWLSKIYLVAAQRIINLEGSSTQAGQLPRFLQRLQNEPVFQGQTFAQLSLEKSEKNPEQLDFKLNTTIKQNSHEARR
jgi:cell division protein FtsB